MADNPNIDIIKLKNSNPLNKYPVDADELNHNFEILQKNQGGTALKQFIESTGQVYTPVIDNQLSMAVAQYVFSSTLFNEQGTTNAFKLYPRDGFSAPFRYTYGMIVSFIPKRTNTGAMTLQIGTNPAYPVFVGLSPVPAGYLNVNAWTSFRFYGTYWEQIVTSGTGGGGGGGGETVTLSGVIREAIVSAGIGYDPTDTTQLAKAISQYVARSSYTSVYANGNYTLTPYDLQYAPQNYTNGMLVCFAAANNNAIANPTLCIGNLVNVVIVDYDTSVLAPNAIVAGELVTCQFTGSNFKLISQHKEMLSLSNGYKVSTISNDATLNNASATALVTEQAAKRYVDTKVKGTKENIIISGYKDAQGNPAALSAVTDHAVQLLANATSSLVRELTPNSAASLSVSGNAPLAINAISKINSAYWESEKSGFAVDDISRIVTGNVGSKYVTTATDATGDPIYLHTPPTPAYFGFNSLTLVYDTLAIKHTDANHTPQNIQLQVNVSPTVDPALWTPLCGRIASGSTFLPDFTYGNLQSLSVDANGYYVISIPKYFLNGDTISAFNPTTSYVLRVVPTLFNQQFADTQTINTPGYNPNTDTSATTVKYTWQIADIVLGSVLDIVPPLVLSYPDGNLESVNRTMYYTQYQLSATTPNTITLDNVANGRYILYKEYGIDTLQLVSKNLVFLQTEQPATVAANVGAVWINLGSVPYETYILTAQGVAPGITYTWVRTSLILLGGVEYLNNAISYCINYNYGDTVVAAYDMTANFAQTITHNFGSDVSVACYLVCVTANNSYAVAENIMLDMHELSQYSTATTSNTNSYFVVSNTNITTRIDAYNLKIIDRNSHEFVSLPNGSWKIRVYITKD